MGYGFKRLWEARIQFKMHVNGLIYGLVILSFFQQVQVGLNSSKCESFRCCVLLITIGSVIAVFIKFGFFVALIYGAGQLALIIFGMLGAQGSPIITAFCLAMSILISIIAVFMAFSMPFAWAASAVGVMVFGLFSMFAAAKEG